jgi:DNA-binding beta-propeller fold protein YncE
LNRLVKLTITLAILTACTPVAASSPEEADPPGSAPLASASGDDTTFTPLEQPCPELEVPNGEPDVSGNTTGSGWDSSTVPGMVLLASCNGRDGRNQILPIDPLTGAFPEQLAPISLGRTYTYAFSPDGTLLAFSTSARDDHRGAGLHLVDLAGWTDTPTSITFDTWLYALRFSPDGKHLLAALPPAGYQAEDETRLYWIDVSSQKIVAESVLPFATRQIAFTSDGSSLAVYGVHSDKPNDFNPAAQAALVSLADMSIVWHTTIPNLMDGYYGEDPTLQTHDFLGYTPGVAFSPDGGTLYIVHADAEKLTTIDLLGRRIVTVDIQPALTWLDWLISLTADPAYAKILNGTMKEAVISPDGSRLYVTGRTYKTVADEQEEVSFNEIALGLQVIELPSGREISRLETETSEIEISPDGARVFLFGWASTSVWTDVVETAQPDVRALHLPGRRLVPGYALDGTEVLLSQTYPPPGLKTILALLDPVTLAELRVWTVSDPSAGWIVNANQPPQK